MTPPLRDATRSDLPGLTDLWFETWHEAHAAFVPQALIAERTHYSFGYRLAHARDRIRLAGPSHAPLGFCIIDPHGRGELDQLFLSPHARGTGLAERLLADGESRLHAAGCERPTLFVLPENTRARRFYARHGWQERGIETVGLATVSGKFPLKTMVLEKDLAAGHPRPDTAD